MKLRIEFKKQDQWIGRYYDEYNEYICLIPCIVIIREKKCKHCEEQDGKGNVICSICKEFLGGYAMYDD